MREYVRDRGGEVDEAGFVHAYKEHQARSRQGRSEHTASADEVLASLPSTEFTGYEGTEGIGLVLLLLKDGHPVDAVEVGAQVEIVTDRTPFYAEGGGQTGDRGVLAGMSGIVDVDDTVKDEVGHFIHKGMVRQGRIARGDVMRATVDAARRRRLRHHHSAMHLLNSALRKVLGPHVSRQVRVSSLIACASTFDI